MSSFFARPLTINEPAVLEKQDRQAHLQCLDLLAFLAICFEDKSSHQIGLHPVLTNTAPDFADVSMGGASFDVRKVKASSFPHGLMDELFKGREFVVVKHPRVEADSLDGTDVFTELARELQVIRHPPLLQHANIIDFLGVMYHDAGDVDTPNVLPALVLEYAEFGNLREYQRNGYGSSFAEKLDIAIDVAKGLEVLHACGIIHGDIKTSNVLICKHPERKVIAKLSDFGFSLSENDARFVGFTKHLEAPEASKPLDRRFLRQLDIYSYGLLLHTVFKDGISFFESVPEDDREENVRKLKESGILAATTQLNLLFYMPDEKCAMFLICKILAYSLQKSPRRRFKDMARIVTLLDFAKPYELPVPNDPAALQPLTMDGHRKLKGIQLDMLNNLINSYCASFSEEQMPLMPILRAEYAKRAEREVDLFFKSHEDWESFQAFSLVTIGVVRDTLGLVPEVVTLADSASNSAPNESNTSLPRLYFSTTNMPDLPVVSEVIKKSPARVQDRIIATLQRISYTGADMLRKSAALLNLGWAYIEGIGVDFDLQKALTLVQESAELGNVRAQQIFCDCFDPKSTLLDPSRRSEWLANMVDQGVARPLWATKLSSKADQEKTSRMRRIGETLTDCSSGFTGGKSMGETEIPDGCYSNSWKKSFLWFAIINDNLGLVQMLVGNEPSLVDRTLFNKETPLLLSTRHGNARITRYLLENGAKADIEPSNGIQALHWLVAFTKEEQMEIGQLLISRGANLNGWAILKENYDIPSAFVDLPVGGTPLHWAVISRDQSGLQTLLELGADPLYLPGQGKSAFEFACGLCVSAAVESFLQYKSVRDAVTVYRPLEVGSPVLIQPLFFVVGGGSRWARLLRHGIQFEQEADKVIRLLVEHGAPTQSVLQVGEQMMTATFAAAWHDCNADILRSGLQYGFQDHLESRWGTASSHGTPLFLSITHRNREMFLLLLKHGADVEALDMYGFTPALRACKETDDVFYIRKLVEAGADLSRPHNTNISPFYVAVHNGNLRTAQYLYDLGLDRDQMLNNSKPDVKDTDGGVHKSILGTLLQYHTRNGVNRIQFLLSLPDRNGDGFIAVRHGEYSFSALHVGVPMISEDPEEAETTRLIMFTLLQKYNEERHLNSIDGPHRSTVLGMATEVGNYKVVKALLEAGADPNIPDEYGRLPLDLLYWRYCYPATTEALKGVDIDDTGLVRRTLDFVNRNTSEILSLLKSYDAKPSVFRFPGWFEHDSGYRSLEWVLQRMREHRSKPQTEPSPQPTWGGLPITIPKRPMQFK